MGKNYTKKQAVSIAISAARLYRDNLVGNKILFVVTDKHRNVRSIQVRFDGSNYHHLTGLRLTNNKWAHMDFYNYCIDGRLREDDIAFSESGTTQQKLRVLPYVFKNANLSASMVGDYNQSHSMLYTERLVGGVKWALGFREVRATGEYVPDTLLEGDIRDHVYCTYRVIATYIKKVHENRYCRMIYKAKNVDVNRLKYPSDWGDLPRLTDENGCL